MPLPTQICQPRLRAGCAIAWVMVERLGRSPVKVPQGSVARQLGQNIHDMVAFPNSSTVLPPRPPQTVVQPVHLEEGVGDESQLVATQPPSCPWCGVYTPGEGVSLSNSHKDITWSGRNSAFFWGIPKNSTEWKEQSSFYSILRTNYYFRMCFVSSPLCSVVAKAFQFAWDVFSSSLSPLPSKATDKTHLRPPLYEIFMSSCSRHILKRPPNESCFCVILSSEVQAELATCFWPIKYGRENGIVTPVVPLSYIRPCLSKRDKRFSCWP